MTVKVLGSPRHLASVLNRSSLWYMKREPYNMMKLVSRTQNGVTEQDIQALAAYFGVRAYRYWITGHLGIQLCGELSASLLAAKGPIRRLREQKFMSM